MGDKGENIYEVRKDISDLNNKITRSIECDRFDAS